MSQSYESFGNYILLERLAMGGMAEIYLARSMATTGVSKFFAIKRILPQYSEQPEFIDMFKDEAKIAVNISHANIVSIYEFGVEKQQFFLAMDYVEGRNLRQILNKMKKSGVAFSIEQVIFIIKEVAAGLDAAHRCIDAQTGKPLNIIHRDMSPQNVMVSFEGEVKVVDFGIAKAETQIETTRAGTLKGKFGYMSPEQAEGQNIDLRTDIFALGIVFWELLANDRLFVANNEVNTLRKIRDCQIPSLRKINPNIPQELERIVSKALAKDRNLRYQTAAHFQRDLSKFLNRHYPDFLAQEFSVFVKTLFAGEILESRKKMIEFARVDTKVRVPTSLPAPKRQEPIDQTMLTRSHSVTEGTDGAEDGTPRDLGDPDEPGDTPVAPRPALRNSPPLVQKTAVVTQQPLAIPASTNTPAPRPALITEPWQSSGLSVDQTGFRERPMGHSGPGSHTSFGTRISYTRTNIKLERARLSLPTLLVIVGLVVGSGAYFYENPDRVNLIREKVQGLIADNFQPKKPKVVFVTEEASTVPRYDIPITSQPAGAEILINDRSLPDVTPTMVQLEANRDVKITLHLPGYVDYEESFHVTGPKLVHGALRAERLGYIDINVVGAGQIYVDGKVVAPGSPANHVPVPADHEVLVSTFDPGTNTGDEVRVLVSEGRSRKITLIPRANYKPRQQR